MLRRLAIISSAFGIAAVMSMLLVLSFDFISQITMFSGTSDALSQMGMWQYGLSALFAFFLLFMPVDIYYVIWGYNVNILTGQGFKSVSIYVTGMILVFFGAIGAFIGGVSAKTSKEEEGGVANAIVNAYLLVIMCNIVVLIIVWIGSYINPLIGAILNGIIRGITGRDLLVLMFWSVAENGTIIAVFSAFVAAILDEPDGTGLLPDMCKGSDVCEI